MAEPRGGRLCLLGAEQSASALLWLRAEERGGGGRRGTEWGGACAETCGRLLQEIKKRDMNGMERKNGNAIN